MPTLSVKMRLISNLLRGYPLVSTNYIYPHSVQVLKERAIEIADKLMPAFNTPTGIPKSLLNLAT